MKDFRNFFKSQHPFEMTAFDQYMAKTPMAGYVSPTIIEEREMHVAQMDVFSRIFMERMLFFGSDVCAETSNIIVSQLLYLDSLEEKDITIYVNSPGGSVYDGNSILDTMRYIKSDVRTIVTGMAASFGAMISMCGTRGKREALPLAKIMIHQPLGGAKGQATDILNEAEEMRKVRDTLYEIIAQRTGQTISQVARDCERDHWFTAQEAKDYGLIDKVYDLTWD